MSSVRPPVQFSVEGGDSVRLGKDALAVQNMSSSSVSGAEPLPAVRFGTQHLPNITRMTVDLFRSNQPDEPLVMCLYEYPEGPEGRPRLVSQYRFTDEMFRQTLLVLRETFPSVSSQWEPAHGSSLADASPFQLPSFGSPHRTLPAAHHPNALQREQGAQQLVPVGQARFSLPPEVSPEAFQRYLPILLETTYALQRTANQPLHGLSEEETFRILTEMVAKTLKMNQPPQVWTESVSQNGLRLTNPEGQIHPGAKPANSYERHLAEQLRRSITTIGQQLAEQVMQLTTSLPTTELDPPRKAAAAPPPKNKLVSSTDPLANWLGMGIPAVLLAAIIGLIIPLPNGNNSQTASNNTNHPAESPGLLIPNDTARRGDVPLSNQALNPPNSGQDWVQPASTGDSSISPSSPSAVNALPAHGYRVEMAENFICINHPDEWQAQSVALPLTYLRFQPPQFQGMNHLLTDSAKRELEIRALRIGLIALLNDSGYRYGDLKCQTINHNNYAESTDPTVAEAEYRLRNLVYNNRYGFQGPGYVPQNVQEDFWNHFPVANLQHSYHAVDGNTATAEIYTGFDPQTGSYQYVQVQAIYDGRRGVVGMDPNRRDFPGYRFRLRVIDRPTPIQPQRY
ncbi:MAG: hypothetical protein SFZ03_12200 [Candidatus Melainabacteria bacterium]|nr:hypothetical protein [Candidatus Melainabacteria bacterium]